VRLTDYQLSGRVTTWKGGLTWEPLAFLKVRYTRSRDIRAPNLMELYFQGGLGAPTNVINRIPNGVVGANGTVNVNPLGVNNTASVTTAAYGPSGGGTTLQPEIADTQTGGFVIQSGGLSSSLDYYHIRIKGLVTNPGFQQVLDSCRDGDTRFCNEITFDPTAANGIGLLRPLTANLDTVTVEGYDAEVGYRAAALGGHFQVRALVNYQPHNRNYGVFTHLTTENANVLGNQPKVGYNFSVGFDKGPLTLDVQVRGFTARTGNAVIYNPDGSINSSTVLGPEDAGYLVTNANTTNKNRWSGQFTVNPSASFKVKEHVSVFANVDNLFNVGPPTLSTNNTYDLIGRRFRAGVRAEF
jgi:outer membrane receptor protein involved in Fe transport